MTRIFYREADGAEHAIDVEDGLSVMRAAVNAGLPGIAAECGGAAACATCQVRIDVDWADRVPPAQDLECSMLDEEDMAENLRLSCQISVEPALEGMVVHLLTKQR